MYKDEETTDGKASPDGIVATLAENTPHLPTSISKRSFMDDAYLEDGPLFRATIKQLEDRTSQLKQSLKKIIKSASAALDIRRQLSRADEIYYDALREMQCAEPLMSHYLNNACHIIQQERIRLDQSLCSQMLAPLRQIYDQDIKMAELKRRQFEEESKEYYASLAKYLKSKKKPAEEEQKKQNQRKNRFDLARFDYLGFLLDVHGGRKENEILFCITDHTIRDFNYYESIATKIESEKLGLDELVSLMTANSLEQEVATNERAAKRKELLCNIDNVDQQLKQTEESSDESAATAPAIPELNLSHHSNEDVIFKGIRDMEQRDQVVGRKKEGFLFATSKPSKSTGGFDVTGSSVTWHKYWCVLSGGQLHEYSNWKRQLEPHIDPINLRFATVREARNAERRFCFEVITPHMRRIYQATSEEETQSWIGTIHNSIESVLNGTSASSANLFNLGAATPPTATTSTKRHGRSLSGAFKNGFAAVAAATATATAGSSANQGAVVNASPSQSSTAPSKDRTSKRQSVLNNLHTNSNAADGNSPSEGAELLVSASSSPNDRFRWSGFSFGSHHDKHNGTNKLSSIQQSSNNNGNYVFSSLPDSEANTRLLSILREDTSNHYCVDCGAKNPDWCSLNLGVLLCIECSGIHRSLGTHISKIRSLTLDSTSYTPDIVELLKSIGNERSNAIWDARFGKTPSASTVATTAAHIPRPNPTDSRAIKLAYIQAKYVGRQFVKKPSEEDSKLTADELLFEAIDQDDIPKALFALASGGNVNSSRPDSTKSPRISLLLPSSHYPQQQQQHVAQKFLPFLMDLDDGSSKKLEVNASEDKDEKQEADGHYIVRYALHYALLHGREATSDELFYPSPVVLQSNSSIKTNNTETDGDESSIISTSSENAHAPTVTSLSISPRRTIFPMAEFLLQNGADTGIVDPETGLTLADLVGMGSIVNDNAIAYISMKNTARGQSAITRSSTILNQHLLSLQQQSIKEEEAASRNNSTEDLSRIEEVSVNDIPPPLPPRKDNQLQVDQ
ncbi:Nudix hydrolase domain-containing protein [Mucor velutinosus]|uniref:Nudix hydrolase domain-containing protein n=1 Tax=Mucor velutinosus TaxID=708070 RepID=A0AAN7D984_9FUNG|nr:Nudix hydrolase domain-containing protein [Mucor velutinosus]